MTRLEKVIELQEIETDKAFFEKQLRAMESHYYERGRICFENETSDFREIGANYPIEFDIQLMKEYINKEIEMLRGKSNTLLSELQNTIEEK